jgi:N-acetylneuraminic acid mutarotase
MFFNKSDTQLFLVSTLTPLLLLCLSSFAFSQDEIWTTKANMLTERIGLSANVVNGKIYIIGGARNSNSSTISAVEEYDPTTDTWTTKSHNMPTPRGWLAACEVNGKIYAIGGAQNVMGTGLSTVEAYDPVMDTWTTKTDMPTARFVHSASVMNGKIYVIGGKPAHGITPLTTVEEYDPATDTWSTITDMPTARFGLTTCVVNGKIYAIGGSLYVDAPFQALRTVEEYDPVTNTWTTKANMPAVRGFFSSSAVNGKIYVIGGGRNLNNSILSTVEEYDPATNTWSAKTDMPTARFSFSVCAVNDIIYAFGGAVTDWQTYQYWQGCSTVEGYDPSLDQPTNAVNPYRAQYPSQFLLHQNYPNPFNPSTTIRYTMPKSSEATLTIYDLLGEEIITLVNEIQAPGEYSVKWNGQGYPSGIYIYRLRAGDFRETRKLVLQK